MNAELELIREQQKQTWDTFSPGWRKWDRWITNYLGPQGEAIIELLQLRPTDMVLDVATGTGEPGLSIARVVDKGRVIGTDLSEGMLAVARDKAAQQGITNFSVQSGDACELPFPDGTFDRVSCRLGLMFFPDMEMAAREMLRVLKPGGRLATTVWGAPEKNPWVTMMRDPILKQMQIPPPPPDAPGMFRCARPGMVKAMMEAAGLHNVTDREVLDRGEVDSIESYWDYTNEVVAAVVAAMSKADAATKARIKNEVIAAMTARYPGSGPVLMDRGWRVIAGEK